MPSAGKPLSWALLQDLGQKGIRTVPLTHATGISSTGTQALDHLLPFPEYFEIPEATANAIHKARRNGNRVIAVGTSVVRALEGSQLQTSRGVTSLRINEASSLKIVDGILTGIHEPEESHSDLLGAFTNSDLLKRSQIEAEKENYLIHEFGDSALFLRGDVSSFTEKVGRTATG
jgi:S-adenosylmethionine:tRNA ribosyltransferase-isomerase